MSFEVQGSALEPYHVVFIKRSPVSIVGHCSCTAGEYGQNCKHRFAILEGNQEGLVSSNSDDVKTVQSWIAGTDIEKALIKMRTLEKDAERIKNELSSTKKHLAKSLHY